MRTIKFRAWHKLNKKMWNVVKLGIRHASVITELSDGRITSHFDAHENDIEIMQYTGLKDKNGKEIYEGDIINGGNKDYVGPPSIVKWDDKGAYFHIFRGDTSSGYTLQGETRRCEVIGNIYENKDLLKSELLT